MCWRLFLLVLYVWPADCYNRYSSNYYQNAEEEVFVRNIPEEVAGRIVEDVKPGWVSALSQAWSSPDRTVDLASLGIDLGAVFDRLLSPAGIVNQFALSFTIQFMFIIGYIVSGKFMIM